jgi:hemerythrin
MDAGSEAYLGHDALDVEHQGQMLQLLTLEKELCGAADQARLAVLLDRLIEFSNVHFMSEQVLMREHAYPGLPAHEAEHDRLMDQMRSFQKRIETGDRPLAAADLSTLRDWVIRHISTKDKAFASYLAHDAGEQLIDFLTRES